MMSSDFWVNTDNQEVINEYWLFVKAIYQQNPVLYNRLFSIQNLIDLMISISEIRDGGHCCAFHRDTMNTFYSGQPSVVRQQSTWIMIEGDIEQTPKLMKKQSNPFEQKNPQKIHNIDKYLGPIAGVLEGVLTTGGNEVVDQIQFIANSLTFKTSACFHLQILKLLKVLLLDTNEKAHCATPADFAAAFLKAKGLHILLHLC